MRYAVTGEHVFIKSSFANAWVICRYPVTGELRIAGANALVSERLFRFLAHRQRPIIGNLFGCNSLPNSCIAVWGQEAI